MPTKKIYSKKNNKIFQKIKCLTHKKKTYKRMTGGSSSSSNSLVKSKTKTAIATILKTKTIITLLTNLKDNIKKMYDYLHTMYNTLFTLYTKFIDKIIDTVVHTIIEDVLWTFRLKSWIDFGKVMIPDTTRLYESVMKYFDDNKSNTNDRFSSDTLKCVDGDDEKQDTMLIVLNYVQHIYDFDYLYTDVKNVEFTILRDNIKKSMTSHVQNNMMNLLSFYKNSDDLKKNLIITKLELLTLLLDFKPNENIDKCDIYNQLSTIIYDYT